MRAPQCREGTWVTVRVAVARTVPPIEFDDFGESEIRNQIRDMARNDDGRSRAAGAEVIVHDGAQRRPVQMIKMRVRDQNQIDGRQIAHPNSGTAQALQNKQPAREVGIDHHALPADLHEKAGVTDEGHPEFAIR